MADQDWNEIKKHELLLGDFKPFAIDLIHSMDCLTELLKLIADLNIFNTHNFTEHGLKK